MESVGGSNQAPSGRRRLALDVAVAVYPKGAAVQLDGEHWSHLDDENQRELAAMAVERGLHIVTERASEGELRVEHMGDAA